MAPPQPLFLGLDCSTQALKASLLSSDLRVLAEEEVRFDNDLAHFGTRGGVLHGPEGSGEVFSPVLQPVEALDLLLERIKAAGWDVDSIRAVSAAGQQHATVYWSHEASRLLGTLDPGAPMAPQLLRAFSRDIIPNWQDSSTGAECAEITAALGSAEQLADATGSSAHTRFSGAQIAKFRKVSPEAYADTARISLVSSMVTTLLCADGDVKGIDESDACGMNLWDMRSRAWSEPALAAVAGGGGDTAALRSKLGLVETDGGRVVGQIGQWFVKRYGFSPECIVLPGTGDNPATFLSLVLRESEGLLSLGTSDVVMVSTAAYTPHPEYHAFFHPAQIAPPSKDGTAVAGAQAEQLRYFNMLVYKNGSLAREHVRDKYFAKCWDDFNAAAERLRPKSAADVPSRTAFWWLLPDIIPANAHGVHKYEGRDAASAGSVDAFADRDAEALAILESQMLNYRSRSSAILGSPAGLSRAYVAGGAGKNPTICAVAADVLACPVSKAVEWDGRQWGEAGWNACSVGVGYKARWGWEREAARQRGDGARASIGFDDLIAEIRRARRAALPAEALSAADAPDDEGVANVAVPGPGAGAYDAAVGWWQALEARALAGK
ncbi:putative D-xylulose kinase A [Vanrija pseudolonga]|uniref:Xylulose kinase n=1 Tax=Vanrija pseudolonga TaxID=143232 RepID=A0AAF0YH17_9TREE|nr:putative D-xylulose kinase A [Vanrija pseudolonga]